MGTKIHDLSDALPNDLSKTNYLVTDIENVDGEYITKRVKPTDLVKVTPSLTSGTEVGRIEVSGTTNRLYAPQPTSVTVTQTQTPTSGTKIGSINVNGTSNNLYTPKVTVTPSLTSGTKVGSIKVGNTSKDLFAPSSTSVTVTPALTAGTPIGSISVNGNSKTLYAPSYDSEPVSIINWTSTKDAFINHIITDQAYNNLKTYWGRDYFNFPGYPIYLRESFLNYRIISFMLKDGGGYIWTCEIKSKLFYLCLSQYKANPLNNERIYGGVRIPGFSDGIVFNSLQEGTKEDMLKFVLTDAGSILFDIYGIDKINQSSN